MSVYFRATAFLCRSLPLEWSSDATISMCDGVSVHYSSSDLVLVCHGLPLPWYSGYSNLFSPRFDMPILVAFISFGLPPIMYYSPFFCYLTVLFYPANLSMVCYFGLLRLLVSDRGVEVHILTLPSARLGLRLSCIPALLLRLYSGIEFDLLQSRKPFLQ